MSSDTDLITLPRQTEMMARLRSVLDIPYLAENFYPMLIQHAGTTLRLGGLRLMIELAIHDYAEKQSLPLAAHASLRVAVPSFIVALGGREGGNEEPLAEAGP